MPVIPFSSAPRIARDAQAAADLREQQAAEEGRRYREAADARLKELKAKGVKKFDPNARSSPISIPEPLEPGGFRINAPGIETPDPYRIAESSPDWNAGDEAMGSGGPENPVNDPALASIAEQMIARQKERASYNVAAGLMQSTATPDQAAADVETAGKAGVSRVQVEADRKTFALKVQQDEFDKLSNESPLTYSWLTQDYDNLEVAKDDHQNLGWWEQTQKFFDPGSLTLEEVGGALRTGAVEGSQQQLYGAAELGIGLNRWLEFIPGMKTINDAGEKYAREQRQLAAMKALANMPKGETWLERGIYGAAQSAPASVEALLVGIATKSGFTGAATMGVGSGGQGYGEAEDAGKGYWDSLRYALEQGTIETATELVPLKFLLGDLAKEAPLGKMFLHSAVSEGIGEQAATFLQDASTWLELHPDKTVAEFFAERPNAALETLVASTLMSGVQVTIAKGADEAFLKVSESHQQKRAEDLANFVRAMGDNAKDSKLLKRLPDKYREAVAAVTKDGPRENIRINPEGIAELAQSQNVTPEQLAQAFRIDPETMVQAMDSGDDIVVPSGNFAAVIQTAKKDIGVSGETIYQALAPHIRLNANDFTARESEAFQKVAKAEADARAEWNTTENDFAASSEQVETDIRDQIRATGRFNEDTVDGQAKLMGQLVNVIAKQTGQDPAAVWKADGFNIMSAVTGEQVDEGSTLPQGAELPADATPTQRLIDMRAKGSSNAEIATALYPDVEAKTAVNRVKALASKHKGKIEERKAALEGKVLAQGEGDFSYTFKVDTKGWQVTRKGYDAAGNFVVDPNGDGAFVSDASGKSIGVVPFANGKNDGQIIAEMAAVMKPDAANQNVDPELIKAMLGSIDDLESRPDPSNSPRPQVPLKPQDKARARWGMVDKPVLTVFGSELAHGGNTANATIALGRTRALIKMFEGANLSSLAHEGAHWYLDLLFRMSKSENPHPFVTAQMARILEFAGKSQEWDGMFDAKGDFTEEGRKLQEQFAEAFEVYLMTGKAPSVGMRSVFNTFKQWILGVYKAMRKGVGQAVRDVGPYTRDRIAAKERELGRKLNDDELFAFVVPQELRDVFDRMLATEDAINAAQTTMIRDSEAMSKAMLEKLDPEGKWKPERQQKFMDRMRERYAEAKERAEAALLARLMDEHTRARSTVAREEERDIRREVASEIDEQPAQRVYQVLSGQGWRDTRADHAEAQAEEADAIGTLAQSQTHDPAGERELDALGFYSAVFEAAKSVRPDVWSMGWDHARNSIVKGGAKINGQRVAPRESEMAYLGLDEMFYGTKLKGAELAEAVLSHIQAKRLLLVENFARFDPNAKAPTKAAMLEGMEDGVLAEVLGLGTKSTGQAGMATIDSYDEITGPIDLLLRKVGQTEYGTVTWELVKPLGVGPIVDPVRGEVFGPKYDVLGTGVWGSLKGVAARHIFNEKKKRILREINLQDVTDAWRESELNTSDRTLVRGPGDIRLPGEDVPLFESVIGLPEGVPGSDYQAPRSHVGGKAKGTLVTAHGEERIDDKGQRTLFTGQVQSDMAQQAREMKEARKEELEYTQAMSVDELHDGQYWLITPEGRPSRGPFENVSDAENVLSDLRQSALDNLSKFDAPLLSTSEWTNVGVRAMVYRAARDGFASVSFPTSETSEIIQGNDTAAGHYDTNVKGALEKIGKQLGGEVRKGSVEHAGVDRLKYIIYDNNGDAYDGFETRAQAEQYAADLGPEYTVRDPDTKASAYVLDITPEMRRKIVSEGFPLFQTRTGKDRIAQPASIPAMRLNLDAVREQYGEEAVAALPPAVRAYSTEATDADDFVLQAKAVRQTLNKKQPKSLWKFLSAPRRIGEGNDKISYRGIRDDGGEILKIIGAKKEGPGLIADQEDSKRSRSYTIEHAAEVAWAEGYFSTESPPTPQEFLDALRADFDGQAKLYARNDMPLVDEIRNAEQWAAWFDENGIDITEKDQAILKAQIETKLSGTSENAIGPDEAAPFFGMSDGKALLEGLKQGPLRDKLIREETKRRMIERHGDTFSDGTLMAEANAYARNEIQHRQFEIELEALADAAGQRAQANLAKQTAIDNLRSKQVREVLNYNQWLTLSERWGKKAVEAAAKGDMAKAMEFARFRLINSIQYVEAKKMAEQIAKDVRYLKSFEEKAKRIKLAKAGQDYLDQMDQLLENIELRKRTNKALTERASLAEWFAQKQAETDPLLDRSAMTEDERMAAEIEEIERSDALAAMQQDAQLRNYQSLTVEELSAVRDQADMIAMLARKKGSMIVEGDRRLLELAVGDVVADATAAKPEVLPPQSFDSFAPKEQNKRGWLEFFGELRTLQSMVTRVDGKDNGALARNTTHKLNTTGAEKTARMKVEEGRMVALLKAAYGSDLSDLRKDQVRINGIPVPMSKMARLTVALYMGTEISRKRMRDGYGWDDATLQEIINTLDQTDWTFVKSVWDYVGSLYPEYNEAHQASHGVPLSKQPGIPVVTRFGVIDGNYFPLKYNPHQSSRAAQNALRDEAKKITGQVGTRKVPGSAKERVKGKVTMPVLLDFMVTLPQHVDEVVSAITIQKALLDAGRIIAHPEVERVIVERHGRVFYDQMLSAMKDARNGPEIGRGWSARTMTRLRNNSTLVALGLNMTTVVKQMIGVTASSVRLGGKKTGAIGGLGWLIKGSYRMGFGAQGMQNGLKFISERSAYMRVRMMTQTQAIADHQRRINNGEVKAAAKRMVETVSMYLTQHVQYLAVDSPLWLGAYEKFIASGADEKTASEGADQVVIEAQGSGEIYQVAAFQRGGPMQRIFTNFITAAIANWNLAVNKTAETNFRSPGQAAIWAINMAMLMSVPVVLTMVVEGFMRGGAGDADDDEPWQEQYLREQLAFLLSPLGLFGQLTSAVGGYAYKGPQGARAFDEASKVIDKAFTAAERTFKGTATQDDAVAVLRPLNTAAGIWLGYPAAALDKFVRGADAMMKGETSDPRALVSGPPRN